MQVGLVGTGRMGAGLRSRWQNAGHEVVAFDQSGEEDAVNLAELVEKLAAPRTIWLMIPHTAVADTVEKLIGLLEPGDTIIDGGNSSFKESQKRFEQLQEKKINFVDVGVSGGLAGAENGYALMVGGEKEQVQAIEPILKAAAINEQFAHLGPAGAGHFVKMVHNSIEYGMMQAIGEGFDLIKNGPIKDIDVSQVAQNWQRGSIVESRLIDLAASALQKDNELKDIAAYVYDSGEGRWATEAAIENAVPYWVNTAALYARFDSRQEQNFSHKIIAALRKEFGGHTTKEAQ